MWKRALSTQSVFCEALVSNQILTQKQMAHAAQRYRLGASKCGGVIFWQIDHEAHIHDGKIMYYRPDCHRDKSHAPTWVSYLLQQRHKWPDKPPTSHCLFGLHLLKAGGVEKIAIVEAEKTAVIMSALYPDYLWLATGGLGEVQAEKFRPLRGHKIVMFPDTDPEGLAFRRWSEAAQTVMSQLFWEDSPPIHVSNLLERHASPSQKSRKIDIADFYLESIKPQKI